MYNSKEEALWRNLWNSDRSFQISISDWATFHRFYNADNIVREMMVIANSVITEES